jgi:hypothetical protein
VIVNSNSPEWRKCYLATSNYPACAKGDGVRAYRFLVDVHRDDHGLPVDPSRHCPRTRGPLRGTTGACQRRVRVWFGEYVIADQRAEPALAERYAEAMIRRFSGLQVTNEPLESSDDSAPAGTRPDVPTDPRLWPLTVGWTVQA